MIAIRSDARERTDHSGQRSGHRRPREATSRLPIGSQSRSHVHNAKRVARRTRRVLVAEEHVCPRRSCSDGNQKVSIQRVMVSIPANLTMLRIAGEQDSVISNQQSVEVNQRPIAGALEDAPIVHGDGGVDKIARSARSPANVRSSSAPVSRLD